ncbi:MAG: sodium:solute symporter [Candidatus Marinimicrobia bacterium]|jgi:SSS family transporter|nr:sodium:solute symporter [Candidatus Neomarinimicrobiota bacterium]MBT3630633.1 sodium:solute symporter [Candidatus Neomarinimicrobiota bacterium]MBT3825077.1 sodium:solute symporter [Candidatus Neomarinimicrobiota bacterium]MBT4132577.1 sodium:solute symporter [Candidatus Neomarinimicrobiota bacterium]MBT4295589.1 sodium:solute symporter [Candidatus Neomarinimicrobiota bacterium]
MLSTLDFSIIILFLAGISAYGIYNSRFNKTSEDYFLAGRDMPWWAAMLSIVATETSVLTFISIPGLAYRDNWFFLQLALGYILGRILVSMFLLPAYFKGGITSIYEVLGERFGKKIQKTASGVFLLTRILADGIRFLATAVIVQVVTGWSLPVAVLVIGAVTVVYTLMGGIRTVVWVDSFQFVLYLGGGLVAVFYILMHSDASFGSMLAQLNDQGKLDITRWGWDLFSNPWLFFSAVFGGMLLSFASHGADYMMVQRVLSVRDLAGARKAMIGSGIFVFIQFSVFLLAGSLIYIYLGGIELEKDREFSTFIVNELPVGLKGLLLAGVLSAAMSTLSSSINSLASSTTTDWMGKTASIKTSRLISLGWAIVLIGIALVFDESDKAIVVMGLEIASFTYGGLLGLFLLTKIDRDFSQISLMTGLVASMAIVFVMKSFGLAWTWFIGFSVLTNLIVVYAVDALVKLRSE